MFHRREINGKLSCANEYYESGENLAVGSQMRPAGRSIEIPPILGTCERLRHALSTKLVFTSTLRSGRVPLSCGYHTVGKRKRSGFVSLIRVFVLCCKARRSDYIISSLPYRNCTGQDKDSQSLCLNQQIAWSANSDTPWDAFLTLPCGRSSHNTRTPPVRLNNAFCRRAKRDIRHIKRSCDRIHKTSNM